MIRGRERVHVEAQHFLDVTADKFFRYQGGGDRNVQYEYQPEQRPKLKDIETAKSREKLGNQVRLTFSAVFGSCHNLNNPSKRAIHKSKNKLN